MTNLSDLLPAGAASKQLSFTANGTIAQGKPVILNANGTVSEVSGQAESVGSEVVFENAQSYHILPIFDSSNNRVVIIYTDTGDSNHGKAIVGTVSGSSITYGTAVTFNAATTYQSSGTFDSNANKVVIVYKDVGDSNKTNSIVGTVDPSDNSISFGSEATITTDVASDTTTTFDSNSNKVVTCYKNTSQSDYGYAAVGTVSGTSISFGTPVTFESAQVNMMQTSACFDSSNNKVVIAYRDVDNSGSATAIVGTVSGTSISFGTAVVAHSGQTENVVSTFDSVNNKVVVAYRENTAPKNVESVVGTVSGTSISFGATATVQSLGSSYIADNAIAFDPDSAQVVLVYMDASNSSYGTYAVGKVSGTSITYQTPVVFAAATTERNGICYDTNADKFVIAFEDGGNSNYATSVVLQVGSTNSSSFFGIADAAISNAASGKITMKGGVAINSAISPAAVVTAGSKVVFDDGGPTTGISLVYDPDNSKIVTAFCTTTLHGIVGTVSGTGISYGTAVQANTNNSGEAQIVYDTANDKVVVIYTNNNNSYGEAVVGTVSGTSISWGSVVVWNSASTSGLSAAYDTNAGKVLVAWKNSGTASGIVGTVSGTSISFGSSATIFSGGNLQETRMVYDANAQKSVVAIRDYSPQKGYAVVATISGTSVTVGSSVEFLSSEVTNQSIALAYNSTDNNVVIAYSKAGDSNNGFLAIGTISGTSISFAGETKYSSSNQTNYVKLAYKPSGNMLGIIYNIGGSTTVKFNHATISGTTFSFGTEQELTAGATDSTAITLDVASDNFVASYGDGANNYDGTTNVVNLNTSLVPNTTYYVQDDGTLSTTSSTVTAGKAMSTTSINLDYST